MPGPVRDTVFFLVQPALKKPSLAKAQQKKVKVVFVCLLGRVSR